MNEKLKQPETKPPKKGWRLARRVLKPRRLFLFSSNLNLYLWVVPFVGTMFALFYLFGMTSGGLQSESGIFVKTLPYSSAMKVIRVDDDVISLRARVLPRFGQEPEITYDIVGYSLDPVEQADGRFVMRKSKYTRYSLSFEELGPVIEFCLERSVGKTVIVILDGNTPDVMSYEKLMELCDLLKQKHCARIAITSPGFRWREPER